MVDIEEKQVEIQERKLPQNFCAILHQDGNQEDFEKSSRASLLASLHEQPSGNIDLQLFDGLQDHPEAEKIGLDGKESLNKDQNEVIAEEKDEKIDEEKERVNKNLDILDDDHNDDLKVVYL